MGSFPHALVNLSLQTLPRMLAPGRNLFCCDLKKDDLTPAFDPDKSLRYTIMSLLGLTRAQRAGYSPALDLRGIYEAVLSETEKLSTGDLGLLLWLDHRFDGSHSAQIVNRIRARMDSVNLDALVTMELAWLITGLSTHASLRKQEGKDIADSLVEYYVRNRLAPSGLIYHTGKGRRRRFPNFATQIYTVHAFSLRARLCGDQSCAERAIRIVECLRTLQRNNGGWPWLYDADRGVVIEPFEVYSVHQHGMAPMAFHELTEAAGYDTKELVSRGMKWLDGWNELGVNMVDEQTGLIYRSIRRKAPWDRIALYTRTLGSMAGVALGDGFPTSGIEVNYTCRPYCLGWLLEAWCDRPVL